MLFNYIGGNMIKLIEKNIRLILIILLLLSVIITSYYLINTINTSTYISYIEYKEDICKINDCHEDTGLCDVTPPDPSSEEIECKDNYIEYIKLQEKNNKYYSNLFIYSLISLFLISLIFYIQTKKNRI
jgi:hypothetical protein